MRGLRRMGGASRWVMLASLLVLLIAALPPVVVAQEGEASVRVVHGVSDAGPIDLYIDGAIAVVGATFPSVTDPLTVSGGEHRIVVTPSGAGPDAALVDSTLTIEPGTTDEIVVAGSAAGLNGVLFEVDRSPLDEEQARVRIVHASPDAGPIDPTLAGLDVAFPTVDYLLATEYVEVPAGVYPLELQLASGAADPLSVPDLSLEAGTVTDVYVVGQVADGSLQPLLVGTRARAGDREAQEDQAEEEPAAEAATDPADAAAESGPRPASLRLGTCEAPGDEVAPIAEVATAAGVEVGPQGGPAVQNGFAVVPVGFDAILGAEHAVVIGGEQPVACGVVGGRLTDDGSLIVPLLTADGTPRGVAVLSPDVLDPTATAVSVFFVPGSDAEDPGGRAAVADTAAEGDDGSPVMVSVEAVGTPAGDASGGVEEVGA